MKVVQLSISNFRGIRSSELQFDGHTLLVGPNNVGKSTICEALDLVLGPDRISRFPPVEEFDFHNAARSAVRARPATIGASPAGSTKRSSSGWQRRLDRMPEAGRLRRQTVEHAFGTLKSWMGATHFLTKTLPRVRTEMSLQVLAYNMKRVIQILGVQRLESSGLVVRCYLPSNRLGRVITQPRSVSDLSVASQGVKPRGFTPVPQTTFSVANQGVQPSLFIPFQ
jgi:hypothetical protein